MSSDPSASNQSTREVNAASQLPSLGLIADDLTGACDAGVQFAQQGVSSLVRLAGEAGEGEPVRLVILDTASRQDLPEVASSKVRRACQALLQDSRRVIYKKVDSTLRGNLGAEIEAALESCGYSLAIVAPAFPALGRSIVAGWLQVGGKFPVPPVHLPSLLRKQGIARVRHFARPSLRNRADTLAPRLEEASATATTVAVIDAASQEDLALIAQAAAELGPRSMLVGSAGLAAEAARILTTQNRGCPVPTSTMVTSPGDYGPVALILGSPSRVTAAQVQYFVKNRPATMIHRLKDGLDAACQALREKRHVVVRAHWRPEDAGALTTFLRILVDTPVRGVILSGGDTAEMVCRALKATAIVLEREIVPGIPWGWLLGGAAGRLPIATKAGGFGNLDALVVVSDFLAALERVLT
jgi:uncharacterized protein YgbK (DUF1537 family)